MLNLFGKNVFARKRKAKAMPIDTVSRIESLEDRIVLAANGVFDGTNLYIYGSGAGEAVTIDFTALNTVTLTGVTGLASAGPITGSIFVDMGNGNDTLTIQATFGGSPSFSGGNIYVDLGSGDDSLTNGAANPVSIQGNLTIIGGTGNDSIGIGSNVGLSVVDLTIDTGADAAESVQVSRLTATGNVAITNGGTGLQTASLGTVAANAITGNLTITQSNAANTGGYTATVQDTNVGGNLTVTNGGGTGDASITVNATVARSVTGSTTLTNGNNDDNTITINGNAALLTLTKNITVKNGNGTGANQIVVDGLVGSASSAASFTNGDADSNLIDLGETTANVFVGTVAATNGQATATDNEIDVNRSTFNRSVNFINGVAADDNTVFIGDEAAVNIVGNAVIKNGTATGDNGVDVDLLNADANVTISNGTAAATTITIGTGVSTIDGNLSITNLATTGARLITVDNTTVSGRTGVAINNVGSGNSTTSLGQTTLVTIVGKLDVQDGTATGTLTTEALNVGSITYNDLGGGVDTINLAATAVGGAGTTTVNGVTRLNLGNGSDDVNIAFNGSTAFFAGLVSISLGSGNDDLDIGPTASSPAFNSGNRYEIDGGTGVDTFTADPLSLSDYEFPVLPRKLRSKITNFESLT